MAYTNTPDESTYRTNRFPLIGHTQPRAASVLTKDQRYLNVIPEAVKGPDGETEVFLRTRPGTTHSYAVGVSGTARGIAYFNSYVFTAIGNKLYRDTTEIATLGNSSGQVGFTQFNGTYTALIVLDGIKGFEIKTDNTVTEITDADFPTPHVPMPVFLDGYLFVARADTDDIYNSNLEDPLTWTAGDFIVAELFPDKIIGLIKNKNYIMALGEKTTEAFYDAAVATGSPLQRNDSAAMQIGCAAASTIAQMSDDIIFVGRTGNGGRGVWILNGFEKMDISTHPVRRSLDAEGTNISNATSFMIAAAGHRLYILNLTSRTWVYDMESKLWTEWSYSDDATAYLYKHACDHPDGFPRALHPSNGNVVKFSESVSVDALTNSTTTAVYQMIRTDRNDWKSNNRKFLHRLAIIGDAPNEATNVPVTVQWSDDDYVTWSTARTINLNNKMSAITQGGSFRRRAFRFIYTGTYQLRWEGMECDINIGRN